MIGTLRFIERLSMEERRRRLWSGPNAFLARIAARVAELMAPINAAFKADKRRRTWPDTIASVIWFGLALPTFVLVRPADLEPAVGMPALVVVGALVGGLYWGIARLLVGLGGRYLRVR